VKGRVSSLSSIGDGYIAYSLYNEGEIHILNTEILKNGEEREEKVLEAHKGSSVLALAELSSETLQMVAADVKKKKKKRNVRVKRCFACGGALSHVQIWHLVCKNRKEKGDGVDENKENEENVEISIPNFKPTLTENKGIQNEDWVLGGTLEGHEGAIRAITPINVEVLATGGTDHTIRLWKLETGQCISMLDAHLGPILSIRALNEGYFASGSQDGELILWKGTAIRRDIEEEEEVTAGIVMHFQKGLDTIHEGVGKAGSAMKRAALAEGDKDFDSTMTQGGRKLKGAPVEGLNVAEEPCSPLSGSGCCPMWCGPSDLERRRLKQRAVAMKREEVWNARYAKEGLHALYDSDDEQEEKNELALPPGPGGVGTGGARTYGEYRLQRGKMRYEAAMIGETSKEDQDQDQDQHGEIIGNFLLTMAFGIWHAMAAPHSNKHTVMEEPDSPGPVKCFLCESGKNRFQMHHELRHALEQTRSMQAMIQKAENKGKSADHAYKRVEKDALKEEIVKLIPKKNIYQNEFEENLVDAEPQRTETDSVSCLPCCSGGGRSYQRKATALGDLSNTPTLFERSNQWGESECTRCGRPGPAFTLQQDNRKPMNSAMHNQLTFIRDATRRGLRDSSKEAENAQNSFETALQHVWTRYQNQVWLRLERIQISVKERWAKEAALSRIQEFRRLRRRARAIHTVIKLAGALVQHEAKSEMRVVQTVEDTLKQAIFAGKFVDSSQYQVSSGLRVLHVKKMAGSNDALRFRADIVMNRGPVETSRVPISGIINVLHGWLATGSADRIECDLEAIITHLGSKSKEARLGEGPPGSTYQA